MLRITLLAVCVIGLAGCAQERAAKTGYVKSAHAYDACLLANPGAPDNCAAQKAVMDNDLQVYNAVSGDE